MEENAGLKDAVNNFIISLEEEQKKEDAKKEEEARYKEKDNVKNIGKKIHKKKETQKGQDTGSGKIKEGLEEIIKILTGIIGFICPEEEIKIEKDREDLKICVYGRNLSILIGKNGKTIDAIEYLLNLIAKRKKLLEKTLIIDIKNYRKQNQEKINKIALKMAGKAIKENRKIVLRPMPSHERKIVHDILSKIKDIKTISRDTEPNRRIVIYPSNNQE